MKCLPQTPPSTVLRRKYLAVVRRDLLAFAVLCVIVLAGGCSSSTTHGVVEGTVTLNGQALAEGNVRFVPVDGKSQTASAVVGDGQFTAKVPVGTMRVEFSAPKVMGSQSMYQVEGTPTVEVIGELLPPKYNLQSELTIDVEAGTNPYAVDLQLD